MGLKKRGEAEAEKCSLREEGLLFATMCIVGLPVDVHVRDGSVYSGTFHTASVYGQYGVVLKDAKLTKKGKCGTNVANGSVVDTLVILSGDLVQVVVKGVLLAADSDLRKMVGVDAQASVNNVPISEVDASDVKSSANASVEKNKITPRGKNNNIEANVFVPRKADKDHDGRKMPPNHVEDYIKAVQVKDEGSNILENGQLSFASVNGRSNGEHTQVKEMPYVQREKSADEEQSSNLNVGTCFTEEKPVEERHLMTEPVPNGISSEVDPDVVKLDKRRCEMSSVSYSSDVCSKVTDASNSVVCNSSESHHISFAPAADATSLRRSTETNKNLKEFKLNPGAKVFSPSFINPVAATSPPLPPFASMAYVPGNLPVLPVAAAQEVGISSFAPRSSVPAKFSPFNNLTAGKGGSSSQFSHPITGYMESRMQPLRYGGQYHTVQTAAYVTPPNSQAVMVGKLGQLVYVQPVSPDFIQSTAAVSPVPARPLLSTHQFQYPKHQGSAVGQTIPVSMPSPFLGAGQQPFVVPSHIPVMQPIPANLPVQGSNAVLGSKFP